MPPAEAQAAPPSAPARPVEVAAPDGGGSRFRLDWWSIAHWASLLAAGALILFWNRQRWFYQDEWVFLGPGGWPLLDTYNGHWSTVPALVFRLLYATVGLRSYVPYMLPMLACHLAAAHLLWRLALREGGRIAVVTPLVAIFALPGDGTTNVEFAFQLGYDLSLAAGLAWLLLATRHDRPGLGGWALGQVLALVSLASSGVGLAMCGMVALAVGLLGGPRRSLREVGLPALAFAVWFATFGRVVASVGTFHLSDAVGVPAFLLEGFAAVVARPLTFVGGQSDSFWRPFSFPIWLGVALLAVGGGVLWRNRTRLPRGGAVAVAMLAGVVLFYLNVAYARLHQFGVVYASQDRYLYVAMALMLPAIAATLSMVGRTGRVARLGIPLLLLALVVPDAVTVRDEIHLAVELTQISRDRLVGAMALVRAGHAVVKDHPNPGEMALTLERARLVTRDGALVPAQVTGEAARLDVLTMLGLDIHPGPVAGAAPPARVALSGDAGALTPRADGCWTAPATLGQPALDLGFPDDIDRLSLRLADLDHGAAEIALIPRNGPPPAPGMGTPIELSRAPTEITVAWLDENAVLRLPANATVVLCGLSRAQGR